MKKCGSYIKELEQITQDFTSIPMFLSDKFTWKDKSPAGHNSWF